MVLTSLPCPPCKLSIIFIYPYLENKKKAKVASTLKASERTNINVISTKVPTDRRSMMSLTALALLRRRRAESLLLCREALSLEPSSPVS